jgi:hypothetical protein
MIQYLLKRTNLLKFCLQSIVIQYSSSIPLLISIDLIPPSPFSQERKRCNIHIHSFLAPIPWERCWGEVNNQERENRMNKYISSKSYQQTDEKKWSKVGASGYFLFTLLFNMLKRVYGHIYW